VITFSLAIKTQHPISYESAKLIVVVKNSFKLECFLSIINYSENISPFPPLCLNAMVDIQPVWINFLTSTFGKIK
jgi:hypothetical protein